MTFKLGDELRDTVTGFKGIAVAKTEWLNGCVRYALQSKKVKDGLPLETYWVDDNQLEVIVSKKVNIKPKITGGPTKPPTRQKDPKFR